MASSVITSPIQLPQVCALLTAAGRQPDCRSSGDPSQASAASPVTITALDPAVTQAQFDTAVATAVAQYDPLYGQPHTRALQAALNAAEAGTLTNAQIQTILGHLIRRVLGSS